MSMIFKCHICILKFYNLYKNIEFTTLKVKSLVLHEGIVWSPREYNNENDFIDDASSEMEEVSLLVKHAIKHLKFSSF